MHELKGNRQSILAWIGYVVIPLLLAGIVYYVFFPEVAFARYIDDHACVAYHIHLPNNSIIEVIRNYAFDVVWAVSFTIAIYLIFRNDLRVTRLLLITVSFEGIMEGIQLSPWVPGTFDVIDLIVEMMASTIVLKYIYIRRESSL